MVYKQISRYFSLGFEAPEAVADQAIVDQSINLLSNESTRRMGTHRTSLFAFGAIGLVAASGLFWGVLAKFVPPEYIPGLPSDLQVNLFIGFIFLLPLLLVALIASDKIKEWRKRYRRLPLELTSWFFLTSGIFARQNLDLADLSLSLKHFSGGAFAASCVISLAVFPWAMRKITKMRPNPGLEVLAIPFSLGFFLDLVRLGTVHWMPTIF